MVLVYLDRDKGSMQNKETRGMLGEDTTVDREACSFRNWGIARIIKWLKSQGLKITPPVAIREKNRELLLIYPTCWVRIKIKEENGVCMIDEALHCMPVEQTAPFGESKIKMMCFPLG